METIAIDPLRLAAAARRFAASGAVFECYEQARPQLQAGRNPSKGQKWHFEKQIFLMVTP